MILTRKEHPYYLEMPDGYVDGWNPWNPNDVSCLECGSHNLNFFWDNGIVKIIHCIDCDVEEIDK